MKREPTPEISLLVENIKLRVKDMRPLNISAVKRESPELISQAFAIRPFLGWAEAVRLSGVPYSVHPHEHVEFLECPICGHDYLNLANHMRLAHESTPRDYGCESVAEAAEIARVGDLRKKPSIQIHWEAALSREYVTDYFARYYSKPNSPKRSDWFQNALTRHCGGSEQICREFGLYDTNVKANIFQSKEAVIAGIRLRHQKNHALNRAATEKNETGLCENAIRLYGDWPTAVRAAGIDFKGKVQRKWNAESVREAFRDMLEKEGTGLRYGQLQKIDPGLVEAVRLHLGPYPQAKASVLADTVKNHPTET